MQPENTRNIVTPQETTEAPAEKKSYTSPEFVAYGSVAELTQGTTGNHPDVGAGSYVM